MKYFEKQMIQFFKDLEKNNTKAWFHENKKVYQKYVKEPMEQLVADVISEMHKIDDAFIADPKKCIGRINRDIRFSKDKTPYNIHYYAHVVKGEKQDPLPGIAFRFGGNDAGIMAGFYMPQRDRIQKIREIILKEPDQFKKLYSDSNFVQLFGTIEGEKNKRLPPEFVKLQNKEPLIANKQFYYVHSYSENLALNENLLELIIEHWLAAKPLNDFLSK